MTNPTPEQLAFALAMITLRRSDATDAVETPSSTRVSDTLLRVGAIAIAGLCATLIGLTYIEGNVAKAGFSDAEIRELYLPPAEYSSAVQMLDEDEPAQTASVR